MNKTVLVIDAGGRGAALVDAYAKSPHVGKILAIPGNDGMQLNTSKQVFIYPHLKTTSVSEIIKIAKKEKVDLVDVSQDNAVEAGLTDELEKNGILAFGPTRTAGQIEWDKAWSRDFMTKYNLPVPQFKICKNEQEGIEFIKSQPEAKWFVKAYGLVEGKGALPAENNLEALEKIKEMKRFGKAGVTFLIEEWLEGEEFSSFAISDGKNFEIIAHAQDHKRIFDEDRGENTGGMGCSTPPLVVTEKIEKQVHDIFQKTFEGLQKEGRQYRGILYLGSIVVNSKIYIIEFNARWGDPEAECVLPGIENDWFEVTSGIAKGTLPKIHHDKKARVVVAGASKGYPGDYSRVKGKEILGLEKASKMAGIKIYSAGIKKEDNTYFANGGRLFYIVGEGTNVLEAREKAYKAMSLISVEDNNLHYRTDIGWRDLERITAK